MDVVSNPNKTYRVAAGGRLKSARNDQGGVMGLHLGGVRGPKKGPDLMYVSTHVYTLLQ